MIESIRETLIKSTQHRLGYGIKAPEYIQSKRKGKREGFLEITDEIIPWDAWVNVIIAYYPNSKRGRASKGMEKMPWMHLIQIWFNLSDRPRKTPSMTAMPCVDLQVFP